MLFSFFKKHEKQNAVSEHFSGFQYQFSEDQKKAIMCSLLLIANSDGEFHHKEHQFFDMTAKVLGYQLKENSLSEVLEIGREQLFRLLASLNEGQKDWYIVTAYGMIHADGKTLDVEFNYLDVILTKMDITQKRFESTLKKTELIMGKYF